MPISKRWRPRRKKASPRRLTRNFRHLAIDQNRVVAWRKSATNTNNITHGSPPWVSRAPSKKQWESVPGAPEIQGGVMPTIRYQSGRRLGESPPEGPQHTKAPGSMRLRSHKFEGSHVTTAITVTEGWNDSPIQMSRCDAASSRSQLRIVSLLLSITPRDSPDCSGPHSVSLFASFFDCICEV